MIAGAPADWASAVPAAAAGLGGSGVSRLSAAGSEVHASGKVRGVGQADAPYLTYRVSDQLQPLVEPQPSQM